MSKKILSSSAGLLFAAALASLMVPGCTIHLGKGSGDGTDETQTDPTGGADSMVGQGGAGDGVGFTPEEQAAIDALQQADPQQVAIATAKASFVGYLINGTIETQGLDPENLEQETLTSLVNTYLPWALDQADTWLSTADPATLSMFPMGHPARNECAVEFGCPYLVKCLSPSTGRASVCAPNDCGDGRCRACPEWFGGFAKIAMTGWCSYVCMDGTNVVGSAGTVVSKFKSVQLSFCIVDGQFSWPL